MNCVAVVVAKAMAPFDRDVLPADVLDGIESEMDCMVSTQRVSSELTPRPTRTMISVNCTEEQDVSTTGGRQGKVFRDYVRRCPESGLRVGGDCKKQKSMRRGINDHLREPLRLWEKSVRNNRLAVVKTEVGGENSRYRGRC
jgi:hypothetical protein